MVEINFPRNRKLIKTKIYMSCNKVFIGTFVFFFLKNIDF